MANPKAEIAEKQRASIRSVMAKNGLNVLSWTKKAGISEGTLRNFLNGGSGAIGSDNLELLANSIGLTLSEMFGNNDHPQSPVVGEIGAGEKFYPYDDHAQGAGLEMVDSPENCNDCVAVRIRGDSMRPLKPGYLVFYERYVDGVPSECIGELCVVKLADESMMLKEVKSGSIPHHYHLISWNNEFKPILDQKLLWASKVKNIRTA